MWLIFCCRNKITFIAWSPDDAAIQVRTHLLELSQLDLTCPRQPKMLYSSSKEALKRSLSGIAAEIQANDQDDIEFDSVVAKVSRGGR